MFAGQEEVTQQACEILDSCLDDSWTKLWVVEVVDTVNWYYLVDDLSLQTLYLPLFVVVAVAAAAALTLLQ